MGQVEKCQPTEWATALTDSFLTIIVIRAWEVGSDDRQYSLRFPISLAKTLIHATA